MIDTDWRYLDSSAFVKLFVPEPEALAVEEAIAGRAVSSELLITEIMRVAWRVGDQAVRDARDALSAISMLRIDRELLERAGDIVPGRLRSLDAIHLATALGLSGDGTLITYDQRLAAAAEALGLSVLSPH